MGGLEGSGAPGDWRQAVTGLMERTATISDCGTYRYDLTRRWSDGPLVAWVGLNPSTADHEVDDPTIRRCIGFARSIKCGGLVMLNLYALRSTKPEHLLQHPDPKGPENKQTIETWFARAEVGLVVAAWGAWWKNQRDRPSRLNVEGIARNAGHVLHCLGVTKDGEPRHPLYVRASQPLVPYRSGAT